MEMFSICEVMSNHAACDVDKARSISCIISDVFRVLKPFSPYLSLTSLVVRWKSFIQMSIYPYLLRDVEVIFVMWGFSFIQISASCFFFVSIRLSRTVQYSREIPGSWIHFATVLTAFRWNIMQLLIFRFPLWLKISVCGILSLLSFGVWVRVVDREVLMFRSNLLPHNQDTLKIRPANSTELRQLSTQLHGFTFLKTVLCRGVFLRHIFQAVLGVRPAPLYNWQLGALSYRIKRRPSSVGLRHVLMA
jgi:hypothetical protein